MSAAPIPASEVPTYVKTSSPVPLDKRQPWYMNTAPTYAGIFLWIAFYGQIAVVLNFGTLWSVLIGAVVAGGICHLMFYYVPGLLGLKTGQPLYIVGTSTFGVKGGYFIPGIFMGLLQIGWYSVATYFSTKLLLNGLGMAAVTPYGIPEAGRDPAFDPTFVMLAIVWGYLFAFIGALGIQYVAKMSQFFPVVPILILIIGAAQAILYGNIKAFNTAQEAQPGFSTELIGLGTIFMVHMVVGFFGTAGAVGADFCSNNRNEEDVKWGGVFGIWLPVIFAGGLAVITVAGARGADGNLQSWDYTAALTSLNTTGGEANSLASIMLILFAVGSMAPACFCSFIIGNSLSTMLGKPQSRIPITLAGATIGILIAVTGASANLVPYFGLIGASFGPVIGAMIADYTLNGGRWAGPREGINWAGYIAWGVGFLVGISNNDLVARILYGPGGQFVDSWAAQATGVYSLIVGFVVYIVCARTMGLPARIEGAVKTEGPR
jgi:cytosine permease